MLNVNVLASKTPRGAKWIRCVEPHRNWSVLMPSFDVVPPITWSKSLTLTLSKSSTLKANIGLEVSLQ